jgi:hypothetical protein
MNGSPAARHRSAKIHEDVSKPTTARERANESTGIDF